MSNEKFQIRPVHFEEIKPYWDDIRKDIILTAQKTQEPYQPVDILRLLKQKQAFVAILEHDGNHIGTLILRPLEEEFSGESILHVFILALKQNGAESDLLDDVWDFVQHQAIESKSSKIQVISGRKGWKKRLARYGFEESRYRAYLREVNHE